MTIVISGVNNNDKITAADGVIDLFSGVTFASELTIPSLKIGDSIQLGNAGIITATSFTGDLTGNVTGNINNSTLLLQTGGTERFRITGNNELGIAGANYGSAGQVLTSGGSGSAVSWTTVSGTTINNNANNRIITGSGTANTLEAETSLEWNGTDTLTVVHPSSYPDFIVKMSAGGGTSELFRCGNGPFRIKSTSTSPSSSADELVIGPTNGTRGLTIFGATNNIFFGDADDNDIGQIQYLHSDDSMRFTTNTAERLRITSDGQLIHNANKASGYIAEFHQDHASNSGQILIDSPTNSDGRPAFIDLSRAGTLQWSIGQGYNHSGGAFHFATSSLGAGITGSKLTITSAGDVGIGIANPGQKLHVEGGSIRIRGTGSNETNGQVDFGDDYRILKYTDQNTMTLQSPNKVVISIDNNNNSTDSMFQIKKDTTNADSGGTELFRVQEDGEVVVNGTISDSKGELRNVPQVTTSSNLVIVSSHKGKHVLHSGSGGWTINTSTGFSVGDMVTLINHSGSSQTIFQASGVTLYDATDGATGDHSVPARGIVTAINIASNVFYLSGNIE